MLVGLGLLVGLAVPASTRAEPSVDPAAPVRLRLPPDIQGPGAPFGAEPPLARFGPWPRIRYPLDNPTPISDDRAAVSERAEARAVSDRSDDGPRRPLPAAAQVADLTPP